MPDVYGLILAGGSGTRLWPRSREELPKQFLSLHGTRTMLQETVMRMLRILPPDHLYAVSGIRWSALVAYQAGDVARVSPDFVIEEPLPRNTAPAVLLGCEALYAKGATDEDLVIVAPSDHIVKNFDAFEDALRKALNAAEAGYMTTLGITPSYPDTGYGYIKRSSQKLGENGHEVECFVEKPDRGTAEAYIKSGDYFWNGGIFVFSLGTLRNELRAVAPDLAKSTEQGFESMLEHFENLPSISFDYALMEKTRKAAVVELDAGWSDVGSWDALYDVLDKDDAGNAVVGDAVLKGSRNCLVDSRNRLTALVDVEDLIVVDSPDALFIAGRGSSQSVRDIVAELRAAGRKEAAQAPQSARPWGTYRILCEEERFKIKRIVISPGKRLSLQYHHHRSEHWIVVRGTALVTIDGSDRFVHEGESVFIPKNAHHRLKNPGMIDLEIVEIQGGEYLGEDDIVRLDDDFNRLRNEQ